MTEEYERSKLNSIILSEKFINVISLHEHMIIEFDEAPSTGYCWHYSISDPYILALEDKKIFNFNKQNILGGRQQIIWSFKCLKCGECKIHFSYYKSWKMESCFLDEYTYVIKVE